MSRRVSTRASLLIPLTLALLAGCGKDTSLPLGPDQPSGPSFARQPLKGVWTVTSLADPGVGECTSESCTLRQALAAAQNGDKIVFKSNLSGTIALTVGFLPFFTSDVTVDGGGRITIDAQSNGRVLIVASGRTVTLNGLTLTGGNSGSEGGAIDNGGTLTITNSTLRENRAGTLGGAIRNSGTLTLVNTTLSRNQAEGAGGGIYSTGSLTITRSTIVENVTATDGGGVYVGAATTTTITASTLSGNVATSSTAARGGGVFVAGGLVLRSSTVTRNSAQGNGEGGGIFVVTVADVANSIIAGNQAISGGHDCVASSFTTSLGYNLTTENGGCPFDGTTDVQVTSAQVFTEVLEPSLNANGGPTRTHALIARGRAVDAGYCPGETLDQRGLARPYDEPLRPNPGDACDIGAFEWRPASSVKPKK